MNEIFGVKGWKSYLVWEGIPFFLLLLIFGFIAATNWSYESKLIIPDNGGTDWTGIHLGLILVAIATAMSGGASVLLFVARIIGFYITKPNLRMGFMFFSLIGVAIFLIFPSLFIIMLGPASITMKEQMRETPR